MGAPLELPGTEEIVDTQEEVLDIANFIAAQQENSENLRQSWQQVQELMQRMSKFEKYPNFPQDLLPRLQVVQKLIADLTGEDGTNKGVIDKEHALLTGEMMAGYFDSTLGQLAVWGGRGEKIYVEIVERVHFIPPHLSAAWLKSKEEKQNLPKETETQIIEAARGLRNKTIAIKISDVKEVLRKLDERLNFSKQLNVRNNLFDEEKKSDVSLQLSKFFKNILINDYDSLSNILSREELQILFYMVANHYVFKVYQEDVVRAFDCIGLASMAIHEYTNIPLSELKNPEEMVSVLTTSPYNWTQQLLMAGIGAFKDVEGMSPQEIQAKLLENIPPGSIIFLLNSNNQNYSHFMNGPKGRDLAVVHTIVKGTKEIADATIKYGGYVRQMPTSFLPGKLKESYAGFFVLSPPKADI